MADMFDFGVAAALVSSLLISFVCGASAHSTTLIVEFPPDDASDTRSMGDIIWTCLLTIFASTWLAIHPNVPGASVIAKGNYARTFGICYQRFKLTVLSIMVPEIILVWVFRQHSVAKKIKQDNPGLTLTHGFLFAMGGFVDHDYMPIVSPNDVSETIRGMPTEFEIEDRSKSDALAKFIVAIHIVWFLVRSFIRIHQHLPLSQLEVLTVSLALGNTAWHLFWWHKPMNVWNPVRLNIYRTLPRSCRTSTASSGSRCACSASSRRGSAWNYAGQLYCTSCHLIRGSSSSEGGARDRETSSTRLCNIGALYTDFIEGYYRLAPDKDLPMLWAGISTRLDLGYFGGAVLGAFSGGLNCLGWSAALPTPAEVIVWRVATVITIALPLLYFISLATTADSLVPPICRDILLWIYVLARILLVALAFSTLRNLPAQAFQDVDWTSLSFLPHF